MSDGHVARKQIHQSETLVDLRTDQAGDMADSHPTQSCRRGKEAPVWSQRAHRTPIDEDNAGAQAFVDPASFFNDPLTRHVTQTKTPAEFAIRTVQMKS